VNYPRAHIGWRYVPRIRLEESQIGAEPISRSSSFAA
jgi:hypothetical protein